MNLPPNFNFRLSVFLAPCLSLSVSLSFCLSVSLSLCFQGTSYASMTKNQNMDCYMQVNSVFISVFLSFCLSVSLYLCLSVFLSLCCQSCAVFPNSIRCKPDKDSKHRILQESELTSNFCLSVSLSLCISVSLSQSLCLSVFLSFCLSVSVSRCLSVSTEHQMQV